MASKSSDTLLRALVASIASMTVAPALSQVNLRPPNISIEHQSCQLNSERALNVAPSPGLLLLSYVASAESGLQSTQVVVSSGDPKFDAEVEARLKACRFLGRANSDPKSNLQGLVAIPIRTNSAREPNRRPAMLNVANCAPTAQHYPEASAKNGEQGTTLIRFYLTADDTISRAEIRSSSGFGRLDATALYMLSQCQFRSATSPTGDRIPSTFDAEYVWRLQ
ncbi:energy transducer TonB [Rubrivivax rivuli]|uniref:Energy transducer TonB n=1 Tax=Rubrivivax rivuli TaxID=1862385 RepID=A0A437RGN3_9BURK|nr:energy transducer TonB [Rubrivivax rivuli]